MLIKSQDRVIFSYRFKMSVKLIATLEGKIQQMANQFSEHSSAYKEMEGKYHTSEAHAIELERKLKSLDNEYCATEVLRNNLKADHLKV